MSTEHSDQKRKESQVEYEQRCKLQKAIEEIRHTYIVVSGKGGVGKSTVAVNVAYGLARSGHKVGLLDIDIHGPNIPKMLGLEGKRIQRGRGGKIEPVLKTPTLKIMSMAFLLETSDVPVIWRGPMKMKVIQEFLSEVNWGALDYLLIDSPPGTGDEPLSACQLINNIDGAIIVTTPQDVAILDGRKCVHFAQQLEVPILGIIENMSGFICPYCNHEIDIFKKGGGEKAAEALGIPFLGNIPPEPDLVSSGDSGEPFIEKYPGSETAKRLSSIVDKVLLHAG